jgi:hypothetical protein
MNCSSHSRHLLKAHLALTVILIASASAAVGDPTVLDPDKSRVDQPKPQPPAVISVDNAKHLLADDWIIEKLEKLERTLHPVSKHPLNPIFKPEMPWEQPSVLLFGTVMYDPTRDADRFRMWYLCYTPKYSDDFSEVVEKRGSVAYAISHDGLHWKRPELGLHEWEGSKQNNIIIPGRPDSICIYFDPLDKDPSRRYKAQVRNHTHRAYFSSDGIHWNDNGRMSIDGYDRSTVHWHPLERQWFASTKSFLQKEPGGTERRGRGYQESQDFLQWSPVSFMCTTPPSAPEVVYNLEPWFYETLFFGQWGHYLPEPDGLLDVQLAVSRNGRHWERPSQGAWIPLSPLPDGFERKPQPNCKKTGVDPRDSRVPWDYGPLSASSLGPVRVGDELWIYYSGRSSDHHSFPQTGAIGLGTLRLDGFYSLDAGVDGGTMLTRPVQLINNTLRLNADAIGGEVRVEILDESGCVIEPFTSENCRPIVGDNVRHVVSWIGAGDLTSIQGRTVRLQFVMKNAKLYAFWTGDERQWTSPDTATWLTKDKL